ncbi:uncharacterized protein LOC115322641 [Ixodes scapularis]|uniref:uncharacterized protein LOC115322641 n=1 Tax=Ixodes scapularis TaxID=6945 RepID=UPI001A9EEEF8|nr:uncharacterized protein LOC115322641 [Ixodes scapularis]
MWYPNNLYTEAARALVQRYKGLKDASVTGYNTWRASLRYRGKNIRRKMMSGDPEVDRAREQARQQKESKALERSESETQSTSQPLRAAPPTAGRPVKKSYFGVREDEISVNGHIAFMVTETRKTLWDNGKVRDAMDRTFEARRCWMTGGKEVSAIVERFPALRKYEEILNEFERRSDKRAYEGLTAFLHQKSEKILKLLMERMSTRKDSTRLMKLAERETAEEKDHFLAVAALSLFPRLVREQSDSFLKKLVPGERYSYPTVLFSGEDAFTSAAVRVEAEELWVDVGDVIHGVSLMIAMYWAFDIQYATGIKSTLALFERAIGVKETPLGMVGVKLLGRL